MISRKQKELTNSDIEAIAEIYHQWRRSLNHDLQDLQDDQDLVKEQKKQHQSYCDVAGLCKSATIEEIRKNNYILTPGRYIEFKETEDDGVAFAEKMNTLTTTLFEQMAEETRLNEQIRENLGKIKY